MIVQFSPVRSDAILAVSRAGDTLTINGEAFDFSVIPEGATLPASAVACEFVVDEVTRTNGVLTLTLLLPYGPVPLGYHFEPEPLLDPADGALPLPAPPAAVEPPAPAEIPEVEDLPPLDQVETPNTPEDLEESAHE
ncbi:hypothetical protein [Pseudomonas oryzihabitans]|uniref:hypothetical protein n=1 Tax=Pseudomonas oryzihabitans TaxID=47885 RepID=UPI001C92CFBB|nr:hypothetical protein [Pseudomonas oryzihabitans]